MMQSISRHQYDFKQPFRQTLRDYIFFTLKFTKRRKNIESKIFYNKNTIKSIISRHQKKSVRLIEIGIKNFSMNIHRKTVLCLIQIAL